MNTVLYIDGAPLLLEDIRRNVSYNRIIAGHVVNGNWELKLSNTTLYAFEDMRHYGWSDELYLRNEQEYETYEEVHVDMHGDYNDIINAANTIRIEGLT